MSEKIVLIDGHSILNRAFFGVPPLTNSEGLHTNAVYGFLNIMFKILDEEKPDYLTVAFDRSEPTFRHQMFDAYKGTRKPMAQELREQVPVMKEVLQAMGITIVEKPGYEADDLLGTIAGMAEAQGMDVSIISGDRDLLQLATDKVKIRIPKTKRTGTEIEDYYAADVVERYQVTPKEFIDVKALMGDSSDNIPGVPGIGEKTATNLIVAYKSIENAYAHLEEITPKRAKTNLEEHYDMAQMSKTLATIEVHAPIEFDMEAAKLTDLYTPEAYVYMKRLEFKNMLTRFSDDMSQNDLEKYFHVYHELDEIQNFFDGFSAMSEAELKELYTPEAYQLCKQLEFKNLLSKFDTAVMPENPIEQNFFSCSDLSGVDALFKKASDKAYVGISLLADKENVYGLGIALEKEEIYYIPVEGLLTGDFLCASMKDLAKTTVLCALDIKQFLKHVPLEDETQVFDIGIGAYLLNPLMKLIDGKLFSLFKGKMKSEKKAKKISRGMAISTVHC